MTLNGCKFKFYRNFALVCMFGRQQRLNETQRRNCCGLKVLFSDVEITLMSVGVSE